MRSSVAVLIAWCMGGIAAAAAIGPASSLLPLADTDAAQLPRSACRTWFTTATGDRYLLMTAGGVAVRTDAGRHGLHRCQLSMGQTDGFGYRGLPMSCAGRRLTMRLNGAETRVGGGRPVTTDATLTIERGGRGTTLTGRSETECGSVSEEP